MTSTINRSLWPFAAAFALACSARLIAQQAPPTDDPKEVLLRVRAELGLARIAAHAPGIQLTGETDVWGDHGTVEYVFDPQWRFTIARSAKLTERAAFDGHLAFAQDVGGEVRECWTREHAENISEIGAISGMLLAQGAGPQWSLMKERTTPAEVALQCSLGNGAGWTVVGIDRATWRPRRWQFFIGGYSHVAEMDGAIEFDGIRFPRTVRWDGQSIVFTNVREQAPDVANLAQKLKTPTDTTFDLNRPPAATVKTSRDGRLLVQVAINGRDAGLFLFDTGANTTVFTPALARDLGLATFGGTKASGIGADHPAAMSARVESLTIGPMTIHDALVSVTDAQLSQALGEPVSGIIGFPALARAVAEVDPQAPRISLFDPKPYKLPAGQWRPLSLDKIMPLLHGSCEQHNILLHLDTGGVATVFNEPAVRRLKLAEGRQLTPERNLGVGGVITLQRTTLKSFAVESYQALDVPADLSLDKAGYFTDTLVDASIGVDAIRGVVTVLDYPGRRAAIVPRRDWHSRVNPK